MAPDAPSADQFPFIHNSISHPPISPPPFSPLPPNYYAPAAPPPRQPRSRARSSPQRSVRFQSPPADPPRSAPDSHSLLPLYTPRIIKYKGHTSEAEYLAALRAWAVDKNMMQPTEKYVLPGFYGKETMEECTLKHPKLRDGRGRKERKVSERAGNALSGKGQNADADGRGGNGTGFQSGEQGVGVEPRRRRRSSLGQWLSRKGAT